MYFEISKKELTAPLKMITGVVEQRHTRPILANALVRVDHDLLHFTATDDEVEIACSVSLEPGSNAGETTIPARKFFEICRSLSDKTPIQVLQEENKVKIQSGKSRFTLSCLPAEEFPSRQAVETKLNFKIAKHTLREMVTQTAFAMANQDVRYYLNGLCLDLQPGKLTVVATDGHRLAMATEDFALEVDEPLQAIIPRKAVVELTRMFDSAADEIEIVLNDTHIQFTLSEHVMLSSKLIDGRFPDYVGVLPRNPPKTIVAECEALKQALSRVAILSNEKHKGVRLNVTSGGLKLSTRNPDQEEAEEELDVEYNGEEFEIGFNVTYLLEALGVVTTKEIELFFADANSSCLIQPKETDNIKFVVMPMRL